ncbi:MAG: TonB-dependent receptor [Gammaproteobacteria bacterium]|nr:TonB-dependent receptor [Gammaproteobacteria bacterium]
MSRKTRRNASKNAARQTRATANRPACARIGMPGFALGAIAFSGSLFAADAAPADSNTNSSDTLQEVVVTGIRASLQKSLDVKREEVGIVDAISAEDIGKFPDSNLATAMERVPGVTVTRAASQFVNGGMAGVAGSTGAATGITVRGFGPQFNETLYDGRQVPTSTGNRGFDFGAVGSDFVGQIDVMKTPDSSLSSGAIGATVNIKYPKPFDRPGLQLAGSVSGSRWDAASTTPNGSLLFSDTFADNTFGFLAAAAYADTKTRGNHVDIQGWEGGRGDGNSGLAPCQLQGAGPCAVAPNTMSTGANPVNLNPTTIKDWFIQDYGIYQEHNEDKRVGGRLVFQARPTDGLEITLDDNYSKETLTQIQQGFSYWFNNSTLANVTQAPDGTVSSFVQSGTNTDFQAAINGQVVVDNTVGLNVKWDATEHTSYLLDAYTATSKLNPDGQLSQLDADIGYGNSAANQSNIGIVTNGSHNLPYPVGFGPSSNASQLLNQNLIGSHVLVESFFQNKDTINQFKLQGQWADEQTKIKYGVQFTHDNMQLAQSTDLPYTWQMYAGYGPAPGGSGGVAPIPSNLTSGTFTTGSGFINGWGNGGNLPPALLAANGYAIKSYLEGLNGAGMNVGACSNLTVAVPCTGKYIMYNLPGNIQNITENTVAPYLSIQEIVKVAEMPLKINVGVRYEVTHVDSSGFQQLPTGQFGIAPQDKTSYTFNQTDPLFIAVKNQYRYLLPNFDLNLAITDTLKARFDASRTLTRPALNQLTPDVIVPGGQRVGGLNATSGNPNLLPYLSDNVDFGMEWYYAQNSYVSADAFVKEVSNFIVNGTSTAPINGVTLPDGSVGQFAITAPVNGPSAEVRGIELGIQHMLWDTGFGFQANATFVGTNKPYNPNDLTTSGFAVTGLANSYNFVPFFEKFGFMVRLAINHQNEFLNNFGQHQANSQFGSEPVFVNASTRVDLSTSYDINRHINVYFEALNLTDDVFSTHGRFKEQILDVVDTGRSYTVGVHAKF